MTYLKDILMRTDNNKICAYCAHFRKPLDGNRMSRCAKRNIVTQEDCTCVYHTEASTFYTDINDDEQGNTDSDSSEFNFD